MLYMLSLYAKAAATPEEKESWIRQTSLVRPPIARSMRSGGRRPHPADPALMPVSTSPFSTFSLCLPAPFGIDPPAHAVRLRCAATHTASQRPRSQPYHHCTVASARRM